MLTYRAVTEFYVLSWVWYFWLLATGLDGLLVAVCSEGSVHLHPIFDGALAFVLLCSIWFLWGTKVHFSLGIELVQVL